MSLITTFKAPRILQHRNKEIPNKTLWINCIKLYQAMHTVLGCATIIKDHKLGI